MQQLLSDKAQHEQVLGHALTQKQAAEQSLAVATQEKQSLADHVGRLELDLKTLRESMEAERRGLEAIMASSL